MIDRMITEFTKSHRLLLHLVNTVHGWEEKKEGKKSGMFPSDEGCYSVLINRQLLNDDTKFREYFWLNVEECYYLACLTLFEKTYNTEKLLSGTVDFFADTERSKPTDTWGHTRHGHTPLTSSRILHLYRKNSDRNKLLLRFRWKFPFWGTLSFVCSKSLCMHIVVWT